MVNERASIGEGGRKLLPFVCILSLSRPRLDDPSPTVALLAAQSSDQSGGECHLMKSSKTHPGFAACYIKKSFFRKLNLTALQQVRKTVLNLP
jgi:hypothetical protein